MPSKPWNNRVYQRAAEPLHFMHSLRDVRCCLWGPLRFLLALLSSDGECDVAPHYLYWHHIYHTLSLIAFICMGPFPAPLLEAGVTLCSFFFFVLKPQIYKRFLRCQTGRLSTIIHSWKSLYCLFAWFILGKCLPCIVTSASCHGSQHTAGQHFMALIVMIDLHKTGLINSTFKQNVKKSIKRTFKQGKGKLFLIYIK